MKLTFYNTLTGKKEEFAPLSPPHVGLYTCGPTVYNYAHIGNLRAYVFADTLRRTLEYAGYTVRHVMNITDVGQLTSDADEGDDKMVKGLKREGLPITLEGLKHLADRYTSLFIDDLKALNIELPATLPRASEHIKEDIEIIQKLERKGIAYRTSDGIYFDVSKFPEYGTRGGFKLGEQREGARVEVNKEKRTPRDFALWKFSTNDIGWVSPWGRGFPGWHIECSAMSRKYLGQPFDIHTGGIDNIPTHHQNEIAQSKAAYDAPLANYWLHSEFLVLPSGKMAKSGENFLILRTLEDRGINPLAYRYYLLQAHYRSPINFTWEALTVTQNAYHKLLFAFGNIESSSVAPASPSVIPASRPSVASSEGGEAGLQSIFDDLNTPALIAEVWKAVREKNREAILAADRVLGLDIENQSKKLTDEMHAVPADIKELAAVREDARRRKDFAKADILREKIKNDGFEIMDIDTGFIIRKRST